MSDDGKTPTSSSEGATAAAADLVKTETRPVRQSIEGALHVLDKDHGTIFYHGDDVAAAAPVKVDSDEDDSFYEVEVTLDDVKSVFKDLQRRREALEDAPFKGQKLRELEKETSILSSLHDHPNTAIRVRFPDRRILQGIFRTSDTVSSIKSWLRQFLSNPSMDFYLFTAPPKKVLQDDGKLVEQGLVAMVVIYFGSQEMPADPSKVLREDLQEKLSDPTKAFDRAKDMLKVRKRESQEDESIKPSTETQLRDHTSQPSNSQQPVRRSVDKGKVPKWFKMK